jgi:penicillin-binding protein 2
MREGYIRFRFIIFSVLMIITFMIIAQKLWQLQIVAGQEYKSSADSNRFRLVPVDAPRGVIYDRFGRLLVRNVPSFTVNIVPAGLPSELPARQAVLQRLGELLNMPVESTVTLTVPISGTVPMRGLKGPSIEDILRERTINIYSPVRIASNVDRQAAFIMEEEHLELPGVVVQAQSLRQYLDGSLMAHILGYVGRIPSERLQEYTANTQLNYLPDDLVGLTGIERTQEGFLRGIKGEKHIEVDAYEREVAVIASEPAIQGHNLTLTIDLELQRYVESVLSEGMSKAGSKSGVAIAMDPRTGEILSMVSLPSYDNNLFSGGISYDDYARLTSDKSHPMVNHAISGQYPPGSTFKIVVANAALQEHVIDRSTTRTCQGILLLPTKFAPNDLSQAQKFYCWSLGGHGVETVVTAIRDSCDIFFYQVAGGYQDFQGLGIDRLGQYAHLFGYGEVTGIPLSGEVAGFIPTDRWKRQTYGQLWYTGDTYNAAIGQGDILATPLQVVNATAVVANRGTLYRPQLVYQVTDAEGKVVQGLHPEPIRKLPIADSNLELVRQGMLEAVAHGTAPLAQLPGIAVAGKTGSAEYTVFDEQGRLVRDSLGRLPTHAWFTAFAPFENPEIAVVVFLEGGGEGSRTAVPVAAKILRYYFGIPEVVPTPTPIPANVASQPTISAGGH